MSTNPISTNGNIYDQLMRGIDLVPQNDYVRHGSLLVERSIDREFVRAEKYLRGDSVMRATFDHLEYAKRPTYIDKDESARGSIDYFSPVRNTISWDPHVAHRFADGGRQSPALALAHEAAHADEGMDERDRLFEKKLPLFDNAEERRVILGPETHAARTLGEGTRTAHDGEEYRVATPTSR